MTTEHYARGLAIEPLESRQHLSAITWDGGPTGTGTDFNTPANWVGDVLPTAADVAIINAPGPTVTIAGNCDVLQVESSRIIQLNSGTLTTTGVSTMSAAFNMGGGTLSGGTWNFSAGSAMHALAGGGTISSVAIGADLLLDTTNATVLVAGSTTFTAARLTTSGATLQIAPGYTLNSLVVAEGAASGTRFIDLAVGGSGTVTIGAGGIIRLASGAGGALNINNSSTAALVNNGLISQAASSRTLSILNSTLINNGTLAITTGTLRISPINWTNPGTLSGTGGTLTVGGTWDTTSGAGTLNTAGSTVNISGTINNTANTITLSAATGSWNLSGGTVNNGSMNLTGGTALRGTTSPGTLNNVAVTGDLLLNTNAAEMIIGGSTTFTTARLSFPNTTLYMMPGTFMNSTIIAEGVGSGPRNITMAYGGAGTVTFGPSAVIQLAANTNGSLIFNDSSSATLINNGLITAAASSNQSLSFTNSSLINNGTLRVTAGSMRINATNWINAGTINALTDAEMQLGGTLNATTGIGTFTTAAGIVSVSGTITNTGNTITLDAVTGSWVMFGGSIVNGSITLNNGTVLRASSSGGTLNNVAIAGQLMLDLNGANVLLTGATTFNIARLSASDVSLNMAPGTTLNSVIQAEGAASGPRNITMAYGSAGTVTFGPSAIVRLAAGTGGGLNLNNSSAAALINYGLISAEAAGRTLLINNSTFTNNGVLRVTAGTLRVNATSWSNTGSINATGGVVQLDGTMNAGASIGTFTTSAGNVNVAGIINNSGSVILLNATTGSWNMLGGNIVGGTMNFADGAALRATTSGGTLTNLALNGELLLNIASSNITLSGATAFTAARLTASNTNLYFAPGAILNSLVVAEGASTGVRNLVLAYGGAGTVTFGPSAVVRLAAGSGGGLNITNSSVAALVNQGLITAEATGQILTIANSVLTNGGTMQVSAGYIRIASTNWTNSGTINGTGGTVGLEGSLNATSGIGSMNTAGATVNVVGAITNSGSTIALNANTGTWHMSGGSILNGTLALTAGATLHPTVNNGTLNGVTVIGDIVFNTVNSSLVVAGATTMTAARLTVASTLYLAPGFTLNFPILAEGAAAGIRSVTLAYGGAGATTVGPSGSMRLMSGAGGGFIVSDAFPSNLINNGLLSAEAVGQQFIISNTTLVNAGIIQSLAGNQNIVGAFTNNGTLRTMNGGSITISQSSWSNAATIDLQGGTLTVNDFTNSGTINLGPGGLLNVYGSVGLTLTSTSIVNSFISGAANNQFGRIVVTAGNAALNGTLNIAMVGAFQPPIISTFNIVTLNQTNRTITSPFTTITMPPPGVDGKNFMFNDSRHIQFAFSSLADFNSDTVVDFFDYLDFVQAFSTNDPSSDFNNDQSIDFFDYLDFVQVFSRF